MYGVDLQTILSQEELDGSLQLSSQQQHLEVEQRSLLRLEMCLTCSNRETVSTICNSQIVFPALELSSPPT